MSDRNTNETLNEQKKARQEFLALKKMQQGEINAPPRPSEIAIVPKTTGEKIKNIWFHDKWYIVGALALFTVIAILVAQCASRTEYDLDVVAFTYTALSDGQLGEIAAYLEQFCEDISGDGEVHVQVMNCTFYDGGNDAQYRYTVLTRLQAVIAAEAQALLFITDGGSYEYLEGLAGEDNSFFEDGPWALPESFYAACAAEDIPALPEGLQISCRTVGGMAIEKDKNIKSYYEQSQRILSRVLGDF